MPFNTRPSGVRRGRQAGLHRRAGASKKLPDALTRKDPLEFQGAAAGDRYNQLARQIMDYRNKISLWRIVTNLSESISLQALPGGLKICRPSGNSFYASNFAIINVEIVGPKVWIRTSHLRRSWSLCTPGRHVSLYCISASRVGVRSFAAVLAVFQYVLITLGPFSIFHFEISQTVIAALLTLVGYSIERHDCDLRPYSVQTRGSCAASRSLRSLIVPSTRLFHAPS